MNKLFTSIAVASLSLTMAVGVGVAVSNSSDALPVNASPTTATWAISSSNKLSTTAKTGTFTDSEGNSWSYDSTQNPGNLQSSNTCQQIGANGSPATVTFSTSDITGTITNVTVECSSYQAKHTVGITVGGDTYLAATATPQWTTIGSKSGTGSSSGEIVITFTPGTSARAMYIKSISVTYSQSGASVDELTTDPEDAATVNLDSQGSSSVSSSIDYLVGYDDGSTGYDVTISSTPSSGITIQDNGEGTANLTFTALGTYNVTVEADENHSSTITYVVSGIPTVQYDLFTGSIAAGDYVIMSGDANFTYVLGNSISSNRVVNGSTTPTVSDNVITNPSSDYVWHIAQSGDYWTIQNAANSKYLAGTSTKNQAALLDDASSNLALWSLTYSATWVFHNLGRSEAASDSANAYLRNNTTSGWAAYTSSQGNAPALFKLRSTDPAISVTVTSGSTSMVAGDSATLTASLINGATGTVNWSKNNNNVTLSDETGLTTTVTSVASGSSTVTASLTNGSTVDPVDIVFTIRGGTADCPYTVAEARAAIDTGEGMTNVYTTGIVSQVDSFNSDYGSITYWISDDGTTTNQLEVYGGLDLNGAQFTDINGVMLGDTVTVFGTLKKYGSTYEYDKNNYLTSHSHAAVTVSSIDSITGSLDAVLGTESWDLSSLVVNGKLDGGSTQDITNYVTKTTSTPVPETAGSTTVQVVVTAKSGYGSATETFDVSATVRSISGPIPNGRYYIAHTLSTGEDLGLPAAEYTAGNGPESVDLSVANTLGCFTFELVDDNTYVVSLGDSTHYLNSIDNNKGIRVNSTKHNWNVEFVSSTGDYDYYTMKDTTYNRYLTSYVASGTSDFRSYTYNEDYFKADRASGGQHGRLMIIPEKSYAEGVADKILESCVNRGSSSYDATAWGNASSAYAAITIEAEKNFLINGSAVKDSTVKLERALEQYDYAVSRYEGIDAFITGRTGIYGLANNASLFAGISTETTTAIIVVVALTSVTAIGVIFFIRRRKYN